MAQSAVQRGDRRETAPPCGRVSRTQPHAPRLYSGASVPPSGAGQGSAAAALRGCAHAAVSDRARVRSACAGARTSDGAAALRAEAGKRTGMASEADARSCASQALVSAARQIDAVLQEHRAQLLGALTSPGSYIKCPPAEHTLMARIALPRPDSHILSHLGYPSGGPSRASGLEARASHAKYAPHNGPAPSPADFRTGVFARIRRAWFAVENQLYIWNYAAPDQNYCMEAFNESIVAVELVPVQPAIFIDDVRALIAVALVSRVVLLGACFPLDADGDSELTLHQTQLEVRMEGGAQVTKILGSDTGRIFLGDSKGNLQEFVYSGHEEKGFSFRKLMSGKALASNYPGAFLVKHSSSTSSSPNWFGMRNLFWDADPIADMILPEGSNLLATLSQRGILQVYMLAQGQRILSSFSPSDAVYVCRIDVNEGAAVRYPQSSRQTFQRLFSYVLDKSSNEHVLVVISSSADRVFYHVASEARQGFLSTAVGWSVTRLGAVSGPSNYISKSISCRPGSYLWKPEAFLFAHDQENDSDILYQCIRAFGTRIGNNDPDSATQDGTCLGLPQHSGNSEYVTELPLSSSLGAPHEIESGRPSAKAWAIAEISSPALWGRPDPFQSTSFSEFAVLTSVSMLIYSAMRPRDFLKRVFETGSPTDVEDFVSREGVAASCALSLEVLLEEEKQTASFAASRSSVMKSEALRVLLSRGRRQTPAAPVSFLLYALREKIAIAVSLIWRSRVFESQRRGEFQRIGISFEALCTVRDSLNLILSCIRKHSLLALDVLDDGLGVDSFMELVADRAESFGRDGSSGDVQTRLFDVVHQRRKSDEFARLEKLSSNHLLLLCQRSIEACWFLIILRSQPVHRLFRSFSVQQEESFCALQFCNLVAGADGSVLANSFIHSMLLFDQADDAGVAAVSESLRNRCPGFFDEADFIITHAVRRLRKAFERLTQGERVEEEIRHSVEDLKPVAWRTSFLVDICEELRGMKFAVEALELLVSAAFSPNTLQYRGEGGRAVDALILEILSSLLSVSGDVSEDVQPLLDMVVSRTVLAGRADFLTELYDHLYRLGPVGHAALLMISEQTLELFLDARDASLLWKLYRRDGRYLDAAAVLADLAHADPSQADLVERISYLTSAAQLGELALSRGLDKAEAVVKELERHLDIARLQLRTRDELQKFRPSEVSSLLELEHKLFDLPTLFERFAHRFDLFGSQLCILACGGLDDESSVRNLWNAFVHRYFSSASFASLASFEDDFSSLATFLYPLGSCFPVAFLVDKLERQKVEYIEKLTPNASIVSFEDVKALVLDPLPGLAWPGSLFLRVGISKASILSAYRNILEGSGNGVFWNAESRAVLLIASVLALLSFMKEQDIVPVNTHARFADHRAAAIRLIALCKSRLRTTFVGDTRSWSVALTDAEYEI
ncbi:Nucleoporin [Porphyridium purpureum]|uniref:Nucleoporin n=1 Tax=Porphyridium purpureum TaxID=35688 RepID=A0A5J4YMJ8_PORPP|nr:Nucleoporin [Porphyridium purpureum]|eukprot:POR2193..scf244_11